MLNSTVHIVSHLEPGKKVVAVFEGSPLGAEAAKSWMTERMLFAPSFETKPMIEFVAPTGGEIVLNDGKVMVWDLPEPVKSDAVYASVTDRAQAHGEASEPDHEVGDLQQALEIALRYVPEEKLAAVMETIENEIAFDPAATEEPKSP